MMKDPKMYDALVKHVEVEISRAKHEAIEREREFSVITGARGALRSLLYAGAINRDYADEVSAWLEKGGIAHLVINGVDVVPPTYP